MENLLSGTFSPDRVSVLHARVYIAPGNKLWGNLILFEAAAWLSSHPGSPVASHQATAPPLLWVFITSLTVLKHPSLTFCPLLWSTSSYSWVSQTPLLTPSDDSPVGGIRSLSGPGECGIHQRKKEDISTPEVRTVWLLSPWRHTWATEHPTFSTSVSLLLHLCKWTAPGFKGRQTQARIIIWVLFGLASHLQKWRGLSKEIDPGLFKQTKQLWWESIFSLWLNAKKVLPYYYSNTPCGGKSLLSAVLRQSQWLLHSAHSLLKKSINPLAWILRVVVKI